MRASCLLATTLAFALLGASVGARASQSLAGSDISNLRFDSAVAPLDALSALPGLTPVAPAAEESALADFTAPDAALHFGFAVPHAAWRAKLTDGLQVNFGAALLDVASAPASPGLALPLQPVSRQARSSVAAIDWNFASWGELGLAASTAQSGFWNADTQALGRLPESSAVGLSAHVGFGDGWVTTFSYNQGTAPLSLKPDALANDTLHSRVYGFAVAKHGLFDDDDSLGVAVSRPLQLYSADLAAGSTLGLSRDFAALPGTSETDLELGYVTTFMNGALALQANAGYQMNVAGNVGANSLSVISRAKINF